MSEAESRAGIERFFRALNERDIRGIEAMLDPEFVLHGAGGAASREQYLQSQAAECERFPDARFPVEDLIIDGDSVAVRYNIVQPTEQPRMVLAIAHMAHGKLCEAWVLFSPANP